MKKLFAGAALVLLIGASGAVAQQSGQNNPAGTSSTGTGSVVNTPIPNAPVGHRQPRRDEVPDATKQNPSDPISKEDAELNRKIKSICRGC